MNISHQQYTFMTLFLLELFFFCFENLKAEDHKNMTRSLIISKCIQALVEELIAGLMKSSSENESKLS